MIASLFLVVAVQDAPPAPAARFVPAWPDLPKLERPLDVGQLPDGRYWIAEQGGRVVAFSVTETGATNGLETILDVDVSRRGNEEGLLCFCPHPGVLENRRVFVHRSLPGPAKGRIAEYRFDDGGKVDPASERVLLEIEQPWRNHNGGQLVFGPDGMLYVGFGDGGAAGDPKNNAQDVSSLLGKILRIDVDGEPSAGLAYRIPDDNPFVGTERARPELWAIGLRNPWRFSFDAETERLWCGDVGQVEFEEICVVARGENHGWKLFEGFAPYDPDARAGPGKPVPPVHAYPRDAGISVTGGFVYRGTEVPSMVGRYVFADYGSGRIFHLDARAAETPQQGPHGAPATEFARLREPASFGLDLAGELYVASFDGRIHKMVPAE